MCGSEDNINSRSTRVRQSLTHATPTSRYEFNFSDRLVFPGIDEVTYSVSPRDAGSALLLVAALHVAW
eukprot:COSAG06_NODE_7139_length_2616_cov_1.464044_4_plen_68_part_00